MGDYVAFDVEDQDDTTPPRSAIRCLMQDTSNYGVSLVELWVLTESRLVRTCYNVDSAYPSSDMIEAVESLRPSQCLPGILWTETANRRRYSRSTRKATQKMLVWRETTSFIKDPHKVNTKRMEALAESFQYVAAVPFESSNTTTKGLVLYYLTDKSKLGNHLSDTYLASSAAAVGHVYVAENSRHQITKQREDYLVSSDPADDETASGSDEDNEDKVSSEPPAKESLLPGSPLSNQTDYFLCGRVHSTLSKSFGGGKMDPPPSMPWEQSLFTFLGALITLSLVTKFSHYLVDSYSADYEIVLGPYGALVTLLFALSGAPAAQPRNAIFGQVISLTIAIVIGQYTYFDTWMKQTLATALSVGCMAKMGVTHPPAGAAAMIFSAGGHNWVHMGMMLAGNIVALGSATLVNNWSDKRQYPTYWGFLPNKQAVLEFLAIDDQATKE